MTEKVLPTLQEIEDRLQAMINCDEIETTLTAAEIVHHAYMLTQYENYGTLSYDELTEYIIRECMDDVPVTIGRINEYLMNDHRYDEFIHSFNDFDEYLAGAEPLEIARMIHFGRVVWTDEYFRIDGYGNIETLTEEKAINEYSKDVKEYMIKNDLLPYGAEAADIAADSHIIILLANKLIAHGY